MWGLEHLLAKYPDARIVFTHRDPVDSMTSYASLTSLVRTMGSADVDRVEIARDWTARLCRAVDHGFRVRETGSYPDALFYDMQFSDFVGDQFSVVKNIYTTFDLPMSNEGANKMRSFIDNNPKGKHGAHIYAPKDFGVEPQRVRTAFRSYIERFGLQPRLVNEKTANKELLVTRATTMRAWRVHKYGQPKDALQLDEVPLPHREHPGARRPADLRTHRRRCRGCRAAQAGP